METSPTQFARQCGVCHAGGGQMEYDRDNGMYSASSPTGDRYTWVNVSVDGSGNTVSGRMVDISATPDVQATSLYGDNRAEVDCMLCHMADIRPAAAYYKNTLNCTEHPSDNPDCGTTRYTAFGPMPDNRFTFNVGEIYDSYNRNIAISLGFFKSAASAAIGAKLDMATGAVSMMPSMIPGAKLSGVPNSANCAQCHARAESDSIGLPNEAQSSGGMIAGYGNFVRLTDPGKAFDFDKVDASGVCTTGCSNDTKWMEFGCKTGMGKRSQKTGQGSSDRFGNGFCLMCDMLGKWTDPNSYCAVPSVQQSCNAKAGVDIVNDGSTMSLIDMAVGAPKKVPGKMPDVDVHDASAKNMKCASCHYTLAGTFNRGTISSGSTVYTYPALTVEKMDHQVAKGWSMLEKAVDQVDGTVTCQGCHIAGENDHPNAAALGAPIAGHAGFPALHLAKIDCRTCHIPAVYSSPGRLLFRDWTAGAYRQTEGSNGNANHFDFAFDFLDGSMAPMPPIRAWVATPEGTKITPILPSLLPVWTGSAIRASDNFVMGWSPARTRDITPAAAIVSAANPGFGIRINGTNDHPLFQGFELTDPLKIESKAKIEAMAAELATARTGVAASHGTVRDPRINLFPTFFDVSHGVLPKEWALGSPSRGGCIMCHSSSDPASPNYSDLSVGFFDSEKELLQNGMMQMANADCENPMIISMFDTNGDGKLTCSENAGPGFPPCNTTGMEAYDYYAQGYTSTGAINGEVGQCKQYMASQLMPAFGMTPDPAFAMDGIDFMQMMAIREGKSATCNPMLRLFGFGWGGNPNVMPPTGTGCDPNADFFSRDEIRKHYQKNLQQSMFTPVVAGSSWTNPITGAAGTVPSTMGRVFGIVSVGKNPSNPSHASKFDIGATCRNPMTGQTFACSDSMPGMTNLVNTTVRANQLLGYTDVGAADLMTPATSGYLAPQANFSWAADTVTSGKVNFNAASTVCANGPCTYAWTFTDPAGTGSGSSLSYVFTGASASATLKVTDANGIQGSITKTVTPVTINNAPTASASSSFPTGTVGYPTIVTDSTNNLSFTDASTDPDGQADIKKVVVNWGDGTVETKAAGSSFSHNYTRAMRYAVTLTVYDNGGKSSFIRGYVKIVPPKYVISGTVKDAGGNALVGAYVSLKLNGHTRSSKITGTGGSYSFPAQLPGTYTIKAYKKGVTFSDPAASVTLTNANQTIDITANP
ncbi:MAG: PKD domain-containing protein [Nitrospiraceae bacterium]|nr:PKD domain-containing protein [Nitrospiraceae bacterium]